MGKGSFYFILFYLLLLLLLLLLLFIIIYFFLVYAIKSIFFRPILLKLAQLSCITIDICSTENEENPVGFYLKKKKKKKKKKKTEIGTAHKNA